MNNQPTTPALTPELALPDSLNDLGQQRWDICMEKHPELAQLTEYQSQVVQAFALSDFIFEYCLTKPRWLHRLLTEQQLFTHRLNIADELTSALAEITSEQQLHAALRHFRNYHMLRIAWRDLLNLQPITESLYQVSTLAVHLINSANDWLYQSMQGRYGEPADQQPMLIMGMGKLGGDELNFSSDIDLIFSYPSQGHTQGGRKSIEHHQFFTKLAQKLIAALSQITAEGQVYRVDMRLRPFGDSGPLVMHFDAVEDYYQDQGRDWERYAMLKGRILNPPCQYSEQLAQILKPFIYRRYLDFSAIESLRSMKHMIQQEVRRRGLVQNIKLGQGGIREAEFIVQSLQLINGGREPQLQVQSLQKALKAMGELNILPAKYSQRILESYLWLRKAEHCLQQFADKQTQELPQDPLDQTRLCYVMGYPNYAEFETTLSHHLHSIHQQFLLLIKEQQDEGESNQVDPLIADIWQLSLSQQETESLYREVCAKRGIGFQCPEHNDEFFTSLTTIKHALHSTRIGQRGLNIINQLLPLVLDKIWQSNFASPCELQTRILKVFKGILGRTAYLQLLWENQGALNHLLKLCDASPWVTEQISRFPLLLDELLNPVTLYLPLAKEQYKDELRQLFLRIEPDDLEQQVESLRQFKLIQQLKIAASDISGALPIMKVSDYLTFLAETLIHQVVDLAWQQMTAKYGAPVCQYAGTRTAENKGFGVIGYGKTGGWELGYGSDLDLVFIHDCYGSESTDGSKPIESSRFYFKLAQRILHIFTIKTGLGWLYEVDMRLRPSGNAGLLVCHVNGFRDYQSTEAWTWEHQALCRARFIDGSSELHQRFDSIRTQTINQTRNSQQLKTEVREMREKMREHLAKGDEQYFDLKQDHGGMADIEFIVQFLLLANGEQYPDISRWTDNVRQLKSLNEQGIIDTEQSNQLTQAYLAFRDLSHQLALQNQTLTKYNPELLAHKQQVTAIWQAYLGD